MHKNLDNINYIFLDKYEREIELRNEEEYTLNDIHNNKAINLRKINQKEDKKNSKKRKISFK